MTYFYLLPAFVLAFVFIEAVVQQITDHFINLQTLERVALSVFVAWALFGWWQEARGAAEVYDEAVYCARDIADQHFALKAQLEEVLGWAPAESLDGA